jgi:large subunit ribosomal protein L10
VPLTKDQKQNVVEEVKSLLGSSKMTVVANYQGSGVKSMQALRKDAKDNGTTVKVIKNRLFKKALEGEEQFKNLDPSILTSQLLYAFNSEDEVAPAQILAKFAKEFKTLKFVGAISHEGKFLSAEEVDSLASLPGKPQLIAEVIATLNSPVNDILGGLSGDLHGLLDGVSAKAST